MLLSPEQFTIVRDDLNHPTLSGNKLHKLAPAIAEAKQHGHDTVISFGGPYSNHLHAMAWACCNAGLNSIGIVRGELHRELTPTLKDAKAWGMKLLAMPRREYREAQTHLFSQQSLPSHDDLMAVLPSELHHLIDKAVIVPEGGSTNAAIDSLAAAYRPYFKQHEDLTHAVCATGTGATLAGLRLAAPNHISVIGVQCVAEGEATLERVKAWLQQHSDNNLRDQPGGSTDLTVEVGHLGGFAKTNDALFEFIRDFETLHKVALDPVYTGKLMFTLTQLSKRGYFSSTDRVLVLHTGGLQGRRGFISQLGP